MLIEDNKQKEKLINFSELFKKLSKLDITLISSLDLPRESNERKILAGGSDSFYNNVDLQINLEPCPMYNNQSQYVMKFLKKRK